MREWMACTTTLSVIAAKAMHACRWIVRGIGIILLSLTLAAAVAWMMLTWITYTAPDIDLNWHGIDDDCFSHGSDKMYTCTMHAVERTVEMMADRAQATADWFVSESTRSRILNAARLGFVGEMVAAGGVIAGAAAVTYGVLYILTKVFCVTVAFLFPYNSRYGLSQDLV
jgi:hypothetical protein